MAEDQDIRALWFGRTANFLDRIATRVARGESDVATTNIMNALREHEDRQRDSYMVRFFERDMKLEEKVYRLALNLIGQVRA